MPTAKNAGAAVGEIIAGAMEVVMSRKSNKSQTNKMTSVRKSKRNGAYRAMAKAEAAQVKWLNAMGVSMGQTDARAQRRVNRDAAGGNS